MRTWTHKNTLLFFMCNFIAISPLHPNYLHLPTFYYSPPLFNKYFFFPHFLLHNAFALSPFNLINCRNLQIENG